MSMYQKCLVCGHAFASNDALEHLDRGRRVAYDPGKGRLWLICPSCARWSLAPIEARWEALEELERLVTDKARLLSRTDNVSLLRAGPLEIVRVGEAQLREEAWWRYGRELQRRRARYRKLSAAGTLGAAAAIAGSWATGGMSFVAAWILWDKAPGFVTGGARWLRFGSKAWRGRGECERCGREIREIRYSARSRLVLAAHEGTPAVVVWCPGCGGRRDTGLLITGQEANHILSRVLAYHHFAGATEGKVQGATRLIEVVGGPGQLPTKILRDGRTLGNVGRIGQVALEIAVHEERERRLLSMKLADLEAHWRKEEELAQIMDGELSPPPASGSVVDRAQIPLSDRAVRQQGNRR